MGKTENIKRAKKLREAKRIREQDALIAAGMGPAGVALKERVLKEGSTLIMNQGKIKYSELLKVFVHPIIHKEDTIAIIKVKYTFGIFAWNAAIIKEKSEESYQAAIKDIPLIMPDLPETGQLFDEMVKRKSAIFSAHKNIIVDFEIKKVNGIDYDLTVATTALTM